MTTPYTPAPDRHRPELTFLDGDLVVLCDLISDPAVPGVTQQIILTLSIDEMDSWLHDARQQLHEVGDEVRAVDALEEALRAHRASL